MIEEVPHFSYKEAVLEHAAGVLHCHGNTLLENISICQDSSPRIPRERTVYNVETALNLIYKHIWSD